MARPIGTVQPGGAKYRLILNRGETYVWRAKDVWEDPTGIVVQSLDATKKIGVFTGAFADVPNRGNAWADDILAMLPPADYLGKEFALPPIPLCGNEPRQAPFNQHPATGAWLNGNYQNSFFRVVAPESNTLVSMWPSAQNISLSAGQWLEGGDNDLPYFFGDAERYYDALLQNEIVPRVIDPLSTSHFLRSSAPVLSYTYMTSTHVNVFDKESPRYQEYELCGGGTWGLELPYMGDPSMVLNVSTDQFSTEEHIPFALLGGSFQYFWTDDVERTLVPTGDLVNGRFQAPRQYVTVVAKCGYSEIPQLFIGEGTENTTPRQIGGGTVFPGNGIVKWQPFTHTALMWEPPVYDGFKYSSVVLPALPNRNYFTLYNPDRIPVSVSLVGMHDCSSYGHPATYKIRKPENDGIPWTDLEVPTGGVALPYSPKQLRVGERTRVRVEVINDGTIDVTSTAGATLTVAEISGNGATRSIVQALPVPDTGKVISGKRRDVYSTEFDYIPAAGAVKLRATVSCPGDSNSANNSSELALPPFVQLPDLSVSSVVGRGPQTRYDALTATATVTLRNQYVGESAYYVVISESTPTGYPVMYETTGTVRFTPDTVQSSQPSFVAQTQIPIRWQPPNRRGKYVVLAVINPHLPGVAPIEEPDWTSADYSWIETNNWSGYTVDVNALPEGNLRIAGQVVCPTPVRVGDAVDVVTTISNDFVRAFDNIPIVVSVGHFRSGSCVEAARTSIAHLATGGIAVLRFKVPVLEVGDSDILVVANPDQALPEARYDDNRAIVKASAVTDFAPDLGIAQIADFAVPVRVTMGDACRLHAAVSNLGWAPVASAYKTQIIDGSADWHTGRVLAEGLLNSPDGIAQNRLQQRALVGNWDSPERCSWDSLALSGN